MDDFLTTDQTHLVQSARRAVANADPNCDPLYKNIKRYIKDDRVNMVDYDVMQTLKRSEKNE